MQRYNLVCENAKDFYFFPTDGLNNRKNKKCVPHHGIKQFYMRKYLGI